VGGEPAASTSQSVEITLPREDVMRRFLLIDICLGLALVAFCVAVMTTVDEPKPPSRRAMPFRSQVASAPPTPVEKVHQVPVL
jgi:hypothetical protein